MKSLGLSPSLYGYLLENGVRETPLLAELRHETSRLAESVMQIAPEQGQFMALLVELLGCQSILEVGTFTGYSTLAMAQALPETGRVVACDLNEQWTGIAKRYWQRAGLSERIELRLGPARETLVELLTQGRSFDLMFIDADKANYRHYYELGLKLVVPGGLILIDNVLWSGRVVDAQVNDPDTVEIRRLNQFLAQDSRVSLSTLPVADGLTLARVRTGA